MKTILVLDASSLFHRAFYGIRPLTTRTGLPTNAVFGYINILKKHLDGIKPDFAIAAFDVHAPTFRHKMDESSKATLKPMPEDLRLHLPYIRRATEALGITLLEKEGYEADDLLGTLARIARERGDRAVLVTGDRDSFQLVGDQVTLILAGTHKDEEITPAVLAERFGLTPRQLIDVKALAGDTSDNIPGVRGIGEKSAVKLIGEKGSLDGVYENVDSLSVGNAAKEKLRSGREDAYRSRALAEICCSVPDVEDFYGIPYEGIRPEALAPLLVELEFSRMLHSFGLDQVQTPAAPSPVSESGQGSIFDWEDPPAERAPVQDRDAAAVSEAPLFLHVAGDEVYALSEGAPCRLTGDVAALLKRSKPVLLDYKAYLHFVAEHFEGIGFPDAAFDLCLAAYVINSQDHSMTLSRLALSYLKENTPPDPEGDPALSLSLMERLYPALLSALGESGAEALYFDVELPLARTLAKMERTGFSVSREGIEEYGAKLRLAADALKEEIFSMAGEEFNIASPKQLGRILFEKMGLPAGKKTKTGYATDAETLSKLRFHSPIVAHILEWRGVTKLYGTYVEGLLSQIDEDGRIRTVFKQNLTATGRLSSAEPNLQNIPVKTELGREMRRFFTAGKKGWVLVDADYSQIELRLLAHMAGDEVLRNYFLQGGDIHTKTASEIFGVSEGEVTPEMRKSAKAVNFGIVYGIGEYSLSQDLGVPIGVARDYIRAYFALFPGIRTYLDSVKERAKAEGAVTTLFGRRRFIPELKSEKKSLVAFGERVAMNAPIQGTAADIIKLAMVRVDQRLEEEGLSARLILQVHDELILEAPEEEAEYAARLLSEEMEGAVSYSVPLIAEAKVGFTWFDAK